MFETIYNSWAEKIPGSRLLHDMRDVLTTDTGLSFDLGQYTLQSYHKRIYAIRKAEPESAPIAPREGRVDFRWSTTNITKGSGISVPANQLYVRCVQVVKRYCYGGITIN